MIGNMPAETTMVPCVMCRELLVAGTCADLDDIVCERCALYSLYSDAYKEEIGFRPRPRRLPTLSQLKAWFEDYDIRHR
jgi:hypothetical protein